jgi:hypothetical protein
LIFGLPHERKEEPMKVRARELAIAQNWKFLISNFKEMDQSHFYYTAMTSISDF